MARNILIIGGNSGVGLSLVKQLSAGGDSIFSASRSDSEIAIGVYLSRVAERVTIDHLRAKSAEKRGGGKIESLETITESEGERAWPVTEPRAEDRLLGRERMARFLGCCRRIVGRRKESDLRILRLALLEGLTSREIGERLYISENTVKNHIRNILDKLGLHSRNEAVLYAVRENLVSIG